MGYSDQELEQMFDITAERIEELDEMLLRGEIPGEPVGEVIVGRPLKFGEPMQTVTFKDTKQHVNAMDVRAHELGFRRSDYLRWLIAQDLATTGIAL